MSCRNFSLLLTLELAFFWIFISENLQPSFTSWLRIWVNDVIFLKTTTRAEILLTIGLKNWTNIKDKVFVILYANCCTNFHYNINPCGILSSSEKMCSNSQPRLGTRKVNDGRNFSELKVQKTWVQMCVINWNLARYLGKIYCVRKCKKNAQIFRIWS